MTNKSNEILIDKPSQDRIALLHPKIREEVASIIREANIALTGRASVRISQGLRTISEQNALYAQGRTDKTKKIVTNAKGGSSYHNFGLAIDVVLILDGKTASWDDKTDFDVEAMVKYCLDELKLENLWVVGWSFGTELTLKYARDSRIKGIILLSPPMMYTTVEELTFWAEDGRPVIAIVPEHDEYLSPAAAKEKFAAIPQIEIIEGVNMKHLWLGEPSVQFVHDQIINKVAPEKYPLPTEI